MTRRLKAEIAVSLALAAENRDIGPALDGGLHRHIHAFNHMAFSAAVFGDGNIADARDIDSLACRYTFTLVHTHRALDNAVLFDDKIVMAGVIFLLIEFRQYRKKIAGFIAEKHIVEHCHKRTVIAFERPALVNLAHTE